MDCEVRNNASEVAARALILQVLRMRHVVGQNERVDDQDRNKRDSTRGEKRWCKRRSTAKTGWRRRS
jgi:hypothetical protein